MDNIIKNPTLIAVVAGVLTYTFLSWKRENEKKYRKNKKNKDKENKKNNDLLISGAISVLVWFIAYGSLCYKKDTPIQEVPEKNVPTYRLVKEISESPKSFTLIHQNGGVQMPLAVNQMPDVFIDNF
jgi:hypothetical protein